MAQRQIGANDADDVAQEVFLATIKAIKSGVIYSEESIPSFARTVAQRQIIRIIRDRECARTKVPEFHLASVADKRSSPEQVALAMERQEIMVRALKAMPSRDRMILTRFYLFGETKEAICAEMGLTETQFRVTKSRAKLSIEEKVRRMCGLNSLKSLDQEAIA